MRTFHLTAQCKSNVMVCPGNNILLYTPWDGLPLQLVLLLHFIPIYYIYFCRSFTVIFSWKCVSMNYGCWCRGKWRYLFLHGKRIDYGNTTRSSTSRTYQIWLNLNFSFLAVAGGRRGKEQTKEMQTFQLCFAMIGPSGPLVSHVTFFLVCSTT